MWYMMVKGLPSSTASQGQEAGCLRILCSDMTSSGQSRSRNTQGRFFSRDRRMEYCQASLSGMMYALSEPIIRTLRNTSGCSGKSAAGSSSQGDSLALLRERSSSQEMGIRILRTLLSAILSSPTREDGEGLLLSCPSLERDWWKSIHSEDLRHIAQKSILITSLNGERTIRGLEQLGLSWMDRMQLRWSFLLRNQKTPIQQNGGGLQGDILLMGGELIGKDGRTDALSLPVLIQNLMSLKSISGQQDSMQPRSRNGLAINTILQGVTSTLTSLNSEEGLPTSILMPRYMDFLSTSSEASMRDIIRETDIKEGITSPPQAGGLRWICALSCPRSDSLGLDSTITMTEKNASSKEEDAIANVFMIYDQESLLKGLNPTEKEIIFISESNPSEGQIGSRQSIISLLMRMRAMLQTEISSTTAPTSPSQEREQGSRAGTQGFTLSWKGSFAKCDPDTCSLRTLPCLLSEDSRPYSRDLPKWGMMRHGVLSELTMQAPPSEEEILDVVRAASRGIYRLRR